MKKINLFYSISLVGCESKETCPLSEFIDLEKWESMTLDEQEIFLDEQGIIYMNENVEYGAYVIDDDEEE